MAEIQKMSITHEAILDWLVLNPERSRGECAEAFGVTEPWLSTITNSDCFQVRWRQRRMMLDANVTKLAEAKMRGVVDKGLERLDMLVETNPDPRFVLETTDKLLARLGYGPKTAGAIAQQNVQNNYYVSKEVLAAARGQIVEAGVNAQQALEQKTMVQLPTSEARQTVEEELAEREYPTIDVERGSEADGPV